MRTPDHVREAVVADCLAGMPQNKAATKHGVGAATVYRIIQAAGVTLPRPRISEEALDAAVIDYRESGDSSRKVAARNGMSADALLAELKRRGATRRPGRRGRPIDLRRGVLDDYIAGVTIAEVALRHGVSTSTVAKWIAEAGLSTEDRDGESPYAYAGGWVLRNGVRRPLRSHRQTVNVLSAALSQTWENKATPQGALTPAGSDHRYNSTRPRSEG